MKHVCTIKKLYRKCKKGIYIEITIKVSLWIFFAQ